MLSRSLIFILAPFFVMTAQAQSMSPITNFGQVAPGIYRGGRLTDEGQMRLLKRSGVKTVLNLQGGDLNSVYGPLIPLFEKGERLEVRKEEKTWADRAQMLWFNLPLNSLSAVSPSQAAKIRQAVAMIQDPRLQPVYVHCEHGIDRTGLIVALYRIKIQRWTVAQAYTEMEANGRNFIHQWFTSPLDDFLRQETTKKFLDSEKQLSGVLNENLLP